MLYNFVVHSVTWSAAERVSVGAWLCPVRARPRKQIIAARRQPHAPSPAARARPGNRQLVRAAVRASQVISSSRVSLRKGVAEPVEGRVVKVRVEVD